MNSHYLYDLCLIIPKVHGSFVRTFRRVVQGCLGEFRIPQQVQHLAVSPAPTGRHRAAAAAAATAAVTAATVRAFSIENHLSPALAPHP
jgi:hypothetical protein